MLKRYESSKKRSCIINISSEAYYAPYAFLNVYTGSKAYMHNFSNSLYHEFKNQGVDIFNVLPSFLKTEMTKGIEGCP